MKAKKLISMFLIGAAAVSLLGGCGSDAENSQEDTAQSQVSEETQDSENEEETGDTSGTIDTADTSSDSGNVLVVYYSATGNTEEAANTIAQITGGDLFELEPADPYTDEDLDWTDDNSRVSQEHEDESLRDVELVSSTVEGFEEYDTVFIGYPIWWGIAAWPVDTFIEANDFTGKTVIPFCTSSSSGIGESGQLLEEMAGTGEWLEGERFRSSASKEDIEPWIESLNL